MEPPNAKKILNEGIEKFPFDKSSRIVKRYDGETNKKQGYSFVIEYNPDGFLLHYTVHLFLAVDDRCERRNVEHRKLGRCLTKRHAKKRAKKHRAILESKWEIPEDYLDLDQRFRIVLPKEASQDPDRYIRPGDHLLANRVNIKIQNMQHSLFIHEGIYMGNKMVINMNGDTLDPKQASVRYDTWDTFVNAFGGSGHLELWIYVLKRRSSQEVVEFAKMRLGEGGYNLFTNNCQAFAQSCHSNKKYTLMDRIRYQTDDFSYDVDDDEPDSDDDDSDDDTSSKDSGKASTSFAAALVGNFTLNKEKSKSSTNVVSALVQHPVLPHQTATTYVEKASSSSSTTLEKGTAEASSSSSSSKIIDSAKEVASTLLQTTITDAKQRILNTFTHHHHSNKQ